MRTSVKGILVAAMIMAAGSFCFGEQIDNPQYKNWSKFKPGTSVTTKTESEMAGTKTEMETTYTLKEVTAEKAVVEAKMSMTMGGNKTDMPARDTDIPAKVEKVDAPANAQKPEVTESSEEVDAAGTKVKAKVTESKMTANGMNITSKTWTSDEVPGMMIKMESTTDGAMKGTTKMTLTAMTIK